MNKIELTRTGVNGQDWSKEQIESWFYQKVQKRVLPVLRDVHSRYPDEESFVRYVENHLQRFILASPEELQFWADYIDNKLPLSFVNPQGDMTSLGIDLIKAFQFDRFRKDLLVELAQRLNVKSCPYCNMHFTLFVQEDSGTKVNKWAKFQYDHFYDKKEYPVLSMSLYNLIPSCAVCNNSKSTKRLSIRFNPYYGNIHSMFRFAVTEPLDLYAAKKTKDMLDISLIPSPSTDKKEFDAFCGTYHLKALYDRQGDLAREVFDKAYKDSYYLDPGNFKFLGGDGGEYIKRLWMGTYPDSKDIEKRPMTKFIQDLWQQATLWQKKQEEEDDLTS